MIPRSGMMGAFLASFLLSASLMAAQDASEFTGTVVTKAGDTVIIRLENAPGLNAGASVSIYKFFTKNILGMNTSGWLHAAEAKLISLTGSIVTVIITEEKSRMTVNNKKVEHLAAGAKVKLALK